MRKDRKGCLMSDTSSVCLPVHSLLLGNPLRTRLQPHIEGGGQESLPSFQSVARLASTDLALGQQHVEAFSFELLTCLVMLGFPLP